MGSITVITFVIAILGQLSAYPSKDLQNFSSNPEEVGGYFEGDMDLDEWQMSAVDHPDKRNGLLNTIYNWPNNELHYEISDVFDNEHYNHIIKGLKMLESVSCLKFYPRTNSTTDYVYVTGENTGCHSSVGRRGGRQTLNLQIYPLESGCFRIGTVVHEFLHALGFYHQQSASDRDDYVTIVLDNIQDGTQHNFNKYTTIVVTDYGVRYDYESVMHYSPTAFSKNGEMTIVPKDPKVTIGQRLKLSDADISKLQRKYNCPAFS